MWGITASWTLTFTVGEAQEEPSLCVLQKWQAEASSSSGHVAGKFWIFHVNAFQDDFPLLPRKQSAQASAGSGKEGVQCMCRAAELRRFPRSGRETLRSEAGCWQGSGKKKPQNTCKSSVLSGNLLSPNPANESASLEGIYFLVASIYTSLFFN